MCCIPKKSTDRIGDASGIRLHFLTWQDRSGIGSSLTAAPAGTGAPVDGGSYGASSRAGAGVGRGRSAGREGDTSGASSSPGSRQAGVGTVLAGERRRVVRRFVHVGRPTPSAPCSVGGQQEPDAATAWNARPEQHGSATPRPYARLCLQGILVIIRLLATCKQWGQHSNIGPVVRKWLVTQQH